MRNAFAALLLLFASASAALAQSSVLIPATTASIAIVGGVTTGLSLITGKANQRIYVTNITLGPTAAAVIAFVYGTGVNCGTGTTSLTGAMTSNGSPLTSGDGYGAILVVPPGQDLCIIVTAQPAPGSLSYAQF
jgi:hypothetical protein